jgi:hypothetical protein
MKLLNRSNTKSRDQKPAARQAETQVRPASPTPLKPDDLKRVGGGDGWWTPIPKGGW